MTRQFRVFLWLAIVGFLATSYEMLALVNGWPVDRAVLVVAPVVFLVGLIPTSLMWKREARKSFRAAIRRKRANG